MTGSRQISPENQLLLCIAQRSIDDKTSEKIRALLRLGQLNWDYLLTTAIAHGVAGLLAQHLQTFENELIPSAVLSQLRIRNQQCVERNLFNAGQLAKIVGALNDSDIPCVAFKGPTLAIMAYGDLTLRQFADLDILIHKSDMCRVKETLQQYGLRSFSTLDRGREAALLRFDNAYAFTDTQDVIVDVHWRFAPLYLSLLRETDDFWDRVESLPIGSQTVMTLSAEDLLLVLCCHGFSHQWERLVWICDVASLIGRRKLDWDDVLRQAKQLGVLRIVLAGLALADELNASLPLEVKKRLEGDRVVGTFARQIGRQILESERNDVGVLRWLSSQLSMRERMRDKVRVLFHAIFTPRQYDWTFASVPPSLWFLYYLIRPIRMAQTHGRHS